MAKQRGTKDHKGLSYYETKYLSRSVISLEESCRRVCTCGHTVFIDNSSSKKICKHCGRFVFRDKQEEFKYRLNEALKK